MYNWSEMKNELSSKEGYAVIMLSDKFIVDDYPLSKENEEYMNEFCGDKLLDIRIFNKEMEDRFFRSDISKEFIHRVALDGENEFYDEEQYLDIDVKRSATVFQNEHKVRTTGGGWYGLPREMDNCVDTKVRIRNYLGYHNESGQAYIRDWRLVEFFAEGEQ